MSQTARILRILDVFPIVAALALMVPITATFHAFMEEALDRHAPMTLSQLWPLPL